MTAPVRVGVLGTASIVEEALIAPARASGCAEVVAVASRDEGRAAAFAARHGIPRACAPYAALLADEAVELVYVPLPNALHVDAAIAALEAGKHVLCEKPLAARAAEAERAFGAAERSRRLLVEAFMYRQHPLTRRLVELCRGGAVGAIRHVRATVVFCDDRPASILREPGLDGGALLDIGCYGVSAARLLLGEPGSVTATAVLGPSGVDERLHATLAFEGGALATVLAAIDLPERFDLEVLGSEGTIVVPSFIHGRRGELYLRRGGAEERIDVERADPYRLQLEDVCGRIRAGVPAAGGAEAVAQARVLEAIARAAATGAAVAVEPAP